uniref:Uncharacterized protein n=1 Tax=Parascaris univalens TaxID=6257 RepID=A0A914ZQ57_PARUN
MYCFPQILLTKCFLLRRSTIADLMGSETTKKSEDEKRLQVGTTDGCELAQI